MGEVRARAIARPVDVASLAAMSSSAGRLWLPETLQRSQSSAAVVFCTALVSVLLGWTLLEVPALREAPLKWVVIWGCACLAGATLWFQLRPSNVRRGWELDFDNARLVPAGLAAQEPIYMDPAHHSLGCYLGGGSESVQTYVLELRHVRRGPVAEISRISMVSSTLAAGRRELQLLDQSVDTLARRLKIRRSGAPMMAPRLR